MADVSRRNLLQRGLLAAGAGLVALAGAKQARASTKMVLDFAPGTGEGAVSIHRGGSPPPVRGDFFYVDAPIFAEGDIGGSQIGTYQCFGVWTGPPTGSDQRLTSIQFKIDGRGTICGLINEGGTIADDHWGAIQGGTGEFAGALGSFRQSQLAPGQNRAEFDLVFIRG